MKHLLLQKKHEPRVINCKCVDESKKGVCQDGNSPDTWIRSIKMLSSNKVVVGYVSGMMRVLDLDKKKNLVFELGKKSIVGFKAISEKQERKSHENIC